MAAAAAINGKFIDVREILGGKTHGAV